MKKFRLLTDMDDVMEDLLVQWLELLKFLQRNNPKYVHKTVNEITDWDIRKFFPMLTIDEVFEPLNTPIIWDMIRPKDGAVQTLEYFNNRDDVDVRILTNSHYSSIPYKRAFLKKYFPFIGWNQVIITAEKQFVNGDVLVDDNPNNLIGGSYKGILFPAPHNKSFDVTKHSNIIRTIGWDDCKNLITKMIEDFRAEEAKNK